MKRLGLIFFVLPGLVFSSAGLGGKIGIAFPEDLDATFTFGFFGRFAINPDLQIEPALNYWSQSEQAANHTLKVSDLSIDASLLWFFSRLKSNFNPYAGFGLGIHSVTVKHTYPWGVLEDSDAEFGMHILGGGNFRVAPNAATFFEARFTFVDDGYNNVSLTWGLQFIIPTTR